MLLWLKTSILAHLVVLCVASTTYTLAQKPPILQTRYASYNGKRDLTNRVDMFLGVAFAKPPIGALRFKRPQPLDARKRPPPIVTATQMKPACYCIIDTSFNSMKGVTMWNPPNNTVSEDCLYLNVWRPTKCTEKNRCTIMVWIYGGAFTSGGANLAVYDGSSLAAEQGVVVVTIGYRTGPLGFLAFDNEEAPGNQGLLDQQLAMKWVRENMDNLYGSNITLFGESAGAASIGFHMLQPKSWPYFDRVILESSSAVVPWAPKPKDKVIRTSTKFADIFGCNLTTTKDTIDCLRDTSAFTLTDKQYQVLDVYFGATIPPMLHDYHGFLTKDPKKAGPGDYKDCPMLIGTNDREGSFFLLYAYPDIIGLAGNIPTKNEYINMIEDILELGNERNNVLVEMVRYVYEYSEYSRPNWLDVLINMHGDKDFICPVVEMADIYAKKKQDVYMYQFNQRTTKNDWPPWMGVIHGYEIEYIFNTFVSPPTTPEKNVAMTVQSYWTNFAKYGTPNYEGAVDWLKYNQNHTYFNIQNNNMKNVPNGLYYKRCVFWRELVNRMKRNECKAGVNSAPTLNVFLQLLKVVLLYHHL